jgi:predicted GNAT superfamily acetyltransferase
VDVLEEDHQEAVWIQTLNQQAQEEQLYAENERLEEELRAEIDRLEKELRARDRADSWRWWTRGALVALLVAGYTYMSGGNVPS